MVLRGCTRQHTHLRGCLQGPGSVQLHRPKVASFHHESTNKGNCRLKTLLIMFSYFFNTAPLSTLSSLHSVLANYTCKANRKLNIPMSRDYRGSGALVKRCGGVSEVGHGTGACCPPASKALSSPQRGGPTARHCRTGGVSHLTAPWGCRATSGGDALRWKGLSSKNKHPLDGGTELRKDCVPSPPSPQSPTVPPAWACKAPLLSCGRETASSPCAQVIAALDFCCLTLLLLYHIQAAPKLPSKLC